MGVEFSKLVGFSSNFSVASAAAAENAEIDVFLPLIPSSVFLEGGITPLFAGSASFGGVRMTYGDGGGSDVVSTVRSTYGGDGESANILAAGDVTETLRLVTFKLLLLVLVVAPSLFVAVVSGITGE